jgi:hypothetical protein
MNNDAKIKELPLTLGYLLWLVFEELSVHRDQLSLAVVGPFSLLHS